VSSTSDVARPRVEFEPRRLLWQVESEWRGRAQVYGGELAGRAHAVATRRRAPHRPPW